MMLHPLFALFDIITMPLHAIVRCTWRHWTLNAEAMQEQSVGQEITVCTLPYVRRAFVCCHNLLFMYILFARASYLLMRMAVLCKLFFIYNNK
jgi:hypothetical protein